MEVVSYRHDKLCYKIFAPRLAPAMEIKVKLERTRETDRSLGELERGNKLVEAEYEVIK